jgi:hypothetical protein
MDLDTLMTTWKSLDERLARIEALQAQANDLERARDAEARARAGQLASRRALRPLAIGLGLQAIAGVTLATIAVAFWAKRMDAGAQFIVYGVLVQAYAVALIASAGHELSLIRRVRMTGAVLDMQGALAALRRWRETVGWVLGLAGGVIWVPLLLMGLAVLGADVWTERPSLIGWLALWAVGGTAAVWAILRWAERHPRFGAPALADVRAFEAEGR